MRFLFIFFTFVFSSFHLIAQDKGNAVFAHSDFQQINYEEGLWGGFLKDNTGEEFSFTMSIPPQEKNVKHPLIIALHWAGPDQKFFSQEYLQCLAAPGFESLNPIIIAPDGKGLSWYDSPNEKRILAFIDLVKEHWPVDENKIVVTGYSRGGFGSWKFIEKYSHVFSAAIPVAAYPLPNQSIEKPVYFIIGAEDKLFDAKDAINKAKKLQKNKMDITIVEANGLSHYEGCAYVSYLEAASKWLQDTVWKNE